MIFPLRILAFGLLAGTLLWSHSSPPSAHLWPLFPVEPTGSTHALASQKIGPGGDWSKAATLAFQLAPPFGQTDAPSNQRYRNALLWVAATSEQGKDLPWAEWLLEERRSRPGFAAELFRAARMALGVDLIPTADQMDKRDTPTPVRLAIHQFWWSLSPIHGRNKSGALLLRETPRSNDLHARLISEVVALSPSREAEELLTDFVLYTKGEERARRIAIRSLGSRGARSSVPFLSSLVMSENRNALLIKEAMLVIMQLSPDDGRKLLMELQTDPSTQPMLSSFLQTLRKANGLPIQ